MCLDRVPVKSTYSMSPNKEDVAGAFKAKSQTLLQIWEGKFCTHSSVSR